MGPTRYLPISSFGNVANDFYCICFVSKRRWWDCFLTCWDLMGWGQHHVGPMPSASTGSSHPFWDQGAVNVPINKVGNRFKLKVKSGLKKLLMNLYHVGPIPSESTGSKNYNVNKLGHSRGHWLTGTITWHQSFSLWSRGLPLVLITLKSAYFQMVFPGPEKRLVFLSGFNASRSMWLNDPHCRQSSDDS